MKFIPTTHKKNKNSGLPNMYLGKRVIEEPLYLVWNSMRQRCYNSNVKNYHRWGGRGITVCKEWKESFISFYKWAMNNGYRRGLTLDRRNNNGNYCPSNCRFVTHKRQVRNTSKTKKVKWGKKIIPLADLCEKYKMPSHIVNGRINDNWDLKKALTTQNLKGKYHLHKKKPKKDMLEYGVSTGLNYTDRKGVTHKIYKGRTGKLFLKKTSINGIIYKYFLQDNGMPINHYQKKPK